MLNKLNYYFYFLTSVQGNEELFVGHAVARVANPVFENPFFIIYI